MFVAHKFMIIYLNMLEKKLDQENKVIRFKNKYQSNLMI